MKTGVSLYSFHNYAKENSLGAKGCIKKAAELGIDGLDFIETGLSYDDYIEYAKDIRKYCRRSVLSRSASAPELIFSTAVI